ncbi:MAG: PilZ domain-containing protein [Pseudobdellovibrio sp.]
MAKIIDMTSRLKSMTENRATNLISEVAQENQNLLKIIDFKDKYQPILSKERRQVERTILSDLISGMIVIPEKGLIKISLYDISNEGLSFTMSPEMGSFKVGEEVALRVYLNRKTYFPLNVKIKHATFDTQEEVVRHGVEYNQGVSTDVALQHFVNFIISLSEGLKIDNGDFMIGPVS